MGRLIEVAAVLVLAASVGCEPVPPTGERMSVNEQLLECYTDDAINNAIVVQHTLYPYHFVENGSELNPLGEHDLRVLAKHYRTHPGDLNVRRGPEAASLYVERMGTVVDALGEMGVDTSRVAVEDALPGGAGMSSERIVRILTEEDRPGGGGSETVSVQPMYPTNR
jgi:hypothetical protein